MISTTGLHWPVRWERMVIARSMLRWGKWPEEVRATYGIGPSEFRRGGEVVV